MNSTRKEMGQEIARLGRRIRRQREHIGKLRKRLHSYYEQDRINAEISRSRQVYINQVDTLKRQNQLLRKLLLQTSPGVESVLSAMSLVEP